MAERTITTWTCSRCGVTEECEDNGQPDHWTRWGYAKPPRAFAVRDDRMRVAGDLCNPCGGLVVEVVLGRTHQHLEAEAMVKVLSRFIDQNGIVDLESAKQELITIRAELDEPDRPVSWVDGDPY